MLIDNFLPEYDINPSYSIIVNAPVSIIYEKVKNLNFRESGIIRVLFFLRGMSKKSLTLEGLQSAHFVKLADTQNQEMVLGLIGKFWTLTGNMQKFEAEEFTQFNKTGFAKAAWNFHLTENPDNTTFVSTETRVYCTDDKSRKRFLRYWKLVGPFSGWIRKEALKIVKINSEIETGMVL